MTQTPSTYLIERFSVPGVFSPEPCSLAAWVFRPEIRHPVLPVVFCLSGGGYNTSYWHLKVPGYADDAYSFARFMARQGCLVIALDHLGVGDSSRPAQGRHLTASHLAAANAAVVKQVRERLRRGTLLENLEPVRAMRVFGIGHSMGAFLAITQQVEHKSYEALALLGWTSIGEIGLNGSAQQAGAALGLNLSGDATLNDLAALIPPDLDYLPTLKPLLHPLFYADDVPLAVIKADEAQGTVVPTGVMSSLCNVDDVKAQASELDIPLFLSNGDDGDVSPQFHEEPSAYPKSPRLVVYYLYGARHCHNFAGTRKAQWLHLAAWMMHQSKHASLLNVDASPDFENRNQL